MMKSRIKLNPLSIRAVIRSFCHLLFVLALGLNLISCDLSQKQDKIMHHKSAS